MGKKYVGEFKDGKWHGQGTYISKDNTKYVGEFKYGQFHGQGTRTNLVNGTKYVGEFKNGEKYGQGTEISPDGTKYVGDWKGYSLDGHGTKTYPDGRIDKGIWKNGKLVERNNIKTQIAKVEPSQTQGADKVKAPESLLDRNISGSNGKTPLDVWENRFNKSTSNYAIWAGVRNKSGNKWSYSWRGRYSLETALRAALDSCGRQKLTNRSIFLYLNDEDFKEHIETADQLIVSGSNF